MLAGALEYYRQPHHAVDFINHLVSTYDPRNAGTAKLATMPFITFPKQDETVNFLLQCLACETNGLIEKCRDMGATWLAAAFSVWLWRFWPGASVGWGSRKLDLVDTLGDADSILEKIRIIIRLLPPEFLPIGFSLTDHMPHKRIVNPENGATITGDGGDNIGRGGRKLIYFVDEAAHLEHPEMAEAALSETTRVRIDISSVNGVGNVFHNKRENGVDWHPMGFVQKYKTNVLVMDWSDHPEKDRKWYEQKKADWTERGLAHIFAQEVDRDYAASIDGIIIAPDWVKAAIDAHKVLGFTDEGRTFGGLDVADEGRDRNAMTIRKGPLLKVCDDWAKGDTGETARRMALMARNHMPIEIGYDSIGVGAGVKAETNRLKADGLLPPSIKFIPWSAAAKPLFPDQRMLRGDVHSPLNADYFENIKAQAWWQLARRFERTFRAVTQGVEYDPGELISIPSDLPKRQQLMKELSQATQATSARTGKLIVNKTPDGSRSPNLADSVVMAYWPIPSGALRYDMETIGI